MKKYIQWLGITGNVFTQNKLYKVLNTTNDLSSTPIMVENDCGSTCGLHTASPNIKIFENIEIVIYESLKNIEGLTIHKKYFADFTFFKDSDYFIRILNDFNQWVFYPKSYFIYQTPTTLPSKKLEITEEQILNTIKENPESKVAFQKLFPDLIKKHIYVNELTEIKKNIIIKTYKNGLSFMLPSEYDYTLDNNFLIPKNKK